MRILVLTLLLCLVVAAVAEEPDVVIDLQRGVGPITFSLEDKQIHELGPVSEWSYFYHGKAWDSTQVWPDDPFGRITAVLGDPPDERPVFITINGFGSQYVLPNGIRLGSSLQEVEALNGRPFMLRAMAQDDAGEVLGWCGGNLEQALPGVTLFFHPLRDLSEGLTEEQLDKVCGPCSISDAPIWKDVYIEVGKIQVARPLDHKPSGPAYADGEEVSGAKPPESMEGLLHDPRAAHNQLFLLSGGSHAVLFETPPDDGSFSNKTTLSLLRRGPSGDYECVAQQELDFSWEPAGALTILPLESGGLEKGLAIAESGPLMDVAIWSPGCASRPGKTIGPGEASSPGQEEPIATFSFPMSHSDDGYPAYGLVANSDHVLEVRQLWQGDDSGKPVDGRMDFYWDGKNFRFANGSRFR